MIVTLGGRRVRSKPGARSVSYSSDRIKIEVGGPRAGRMIAAAFKNEVQADIRAIREPAADSTMDRRSTKKEKFGKWLGFIAAGRKRARKHIGKGYFGNDTGRLADGLRVEWNPETQALEFWNAQPPAGRFNDGAGNPPREFTDRDGSTERYDVFRTKLQALCETLRNPRAIWRRPRVQAAIKRAQKSAVKIERVR